MTGGPRRLWHRLRYGVRRWPPPAMIGPERADIRARVAFLSALDAGLEERDYPETPYYRFLESLESWSPVRARTAARGFVELYRSLREEGYLGGGHGADHILLARMPNPYRTHVPPPSEGRPGMLVPRRTALARGAHRLAILVHLGIERAPVRVLRMPGFRAPDYTTYMEERGLLID